MLLYFHLGVSTVSLCKSVIDNSILIVVRPSHFFNCLKCFERYRYMKNNSVFQLPQFIRKVSHDLEAAASLCEFECRVRPVEFKEKGKCLHL